MGETDSVVIEAVLTGTARPLGPDGQPSAISKRPVSGPRYVRLLGLAGDEQADLRVHGGPDKAVHHYPRDHYPDWIEALGPIDALESPGAFGENISTSGWTERDVCLGDRLRLGTALVELAQGRQPCWKQAAHLGAPTVVSAMVATGRTGWYYRVIEEGEISPGDRATLVERPIPQWPVSRLFRLIIGGEHKGQQTALRELAAFPVLADGWRRRAEWLARKR